MIKAVFFDYNGTCSDLRGRDMSGFRFDSHCNPFRPLHEMLPPKVVYDLVTAPLWPDMVKINQLSIVKCILTNNSNSMMNQAYSIFAPVFWHCVTSDQHEKYKPDKEVYEYAARHFDTPVENCLMVAAHNFDLKGAKSVGMKTCFIDRDGEDFNEGDYDFHIKNFSELVDICKTKD